MYIYLKVQLLDYVWKSFKTYLAFKPCRKKDASEYFMVFVHILRKLQVKIFLDSVNVHFQNKGKDLSY